MCPCPCGQLCGQIAAMAYYASKSTQGWATSDVHEGCPSSQVVRVLLPNNCDKKIGWRIQAVDCNAKATMTRNSG